MKPVRALALVLLIVGAVLLLSQGGSAAQAVDEGPAVLPAQIEAENFDRGSPGVDYDDTDRAFGNVPVEEIDASNAVDVWTINNTGTSGALIGRTRNGEFVQYTIMAEEAGAYDVRLSVASGAENPGVIHVDIDGERLGTVSGDTDRWFDWTTRSAGIAEVSPGEHVVRLTWEDGANVNFDWLDFMPVGPQEAACDQGQVEAEDAMVSGRFVTVASDEASGGAHVEVPQGSGGWWNGVSDSYVEFCLGVSEAGTYNVEAGLRAPSPRDNSFYVAVDSGPLVEFVADVTGDEYGTDMVNESGARDPLRVSISDVPLIDAVGYDLEAGDHSVRFYLRRDGVELDWIRFTPVAEGIGWEACNVQFQQDVWPDEFSAEFGGPVRFECATVDVPLDYAIPDGETIQLAVIRIPAADQANKIGSLFTNPGGPNGSGVDFTLQSAPIAFGPDIRANFDIVGFDPRGVQRSEPTRCFGFDKDLPPLVELVYPVTDQDVAIWLDNDAQVQEACIQNGGKILNHMSTANVARDLDVLREAVGDEQLTFIGYSYGSMIGSTYANLFPQNVRALAIDSALDPIAWTTGYGDDAATIPMTSRLNSEGGAQDSLDHFFALCDEAGSAACPIAPDSAARYEAVHAALTVEPLIDRFEFIDFETGETIVEEFTFGAPELVGQTLGILYSGDAWPIISFIVADLEAQLFAPDPGQQAELQDQFARDIHALRNGEANTFVSRAGIWPGSVGADTGNGLPSGYAFFFEGLKAVLCLDSDNPNNAEAWANAAAALDETSYFGSLWTWDSSVCNGWPAFDEGRYTGPWDEETANPVLIVNTEFDPATALSGAVALDGILANSQLLVVDGGRGHIAAQGSECAREATENYLLTQQLPPVDLVCQPTNIDPFALDLFPEPPTITVVIEGPDGPQGDPIVIETLTVDGVPIQPPVILDGPDGETIIIEPVIVPLGTGVVVTVETSTGPATFPPFDIVDENGELVSVEANVYRDVVIIDVIVEGGGDPLPPPVVIEAIEAIVILPNGDEALVVLFDTPDGPVAVDPETGEALNIDEETGEILPIEIIEILGPAQPPAPELIEGVKALVRLPNGDEVIAVLIGSPDGAVALDPNTGAPLNVDPETGELLPIEIIEVLGPAEVPAPGAAPIPIEPIAPPLEVFEAIVVLPNGDEVTAILLGPLDDPLVIDPETGAPLNIDEVTGELLPIEIIEILGPGELPAPQPIEVLEAIVVLPNGDEVTAILLDTPDGPVAIDPVSGAPLNVEEATGEILPIEIIEILGPAEFPPLPIEEPPVLVEP